MELILAEQVLLLALDDEKGKDSTSWGMDPGLSAALLLDLARLGLVEAVDGKVRALEGDEPGHPLLRDAHAAMLEPDRERGAKQWVDTLPKRLKPLKDRLAGGLVERAVLSEERSKRFGLFTSTRYPEADPAAERELRARMHEVLVTGREPTEPEALLAGLLEPLGLVDGVVGKPERKQARKRAKEIGESGVAGTAVRDAVREVQAAVITAAIVPAIAASSVSS
jgi:Golgi phosphoprotein 3 (GPP34)